MAVDISRIPMVSVPFADNDQTKVANIDFLKSGVTATMTAPTKNGGIGFTRGHLNGIGYFATLGAFLDRIGYPYGIRRDSSEDFAGYPKGAILISEDGDYVREYVSQIDNNKEPLPSEADDGTYVGNEYWKPTLPPATDFAPDFTTYTNKTILAIEGKGSVTYTPDEDGWYQLYLLFNGYYWPQTPTFDNDLGTSTCSVMIGDAEICRLDGRLTIKTKNTDYSREMPITSVLVPLKKGQPVKFVYTLVSNQSAKYHEATIKIRRWGISSL